MTNSTLKDWMILVGAGASYGQHKKFHPPLGKDLAQELRTKDSRFSQIEKSTAQTCGEDFESWLSSIGDNSVAFTDSLAVVSHYFRQFKQINKKSRYFDLIDILGEKGINRCTFLSLNYESLLEMALRKKGYLLDWGSSSMDGDRFNPREGVGVVPFYKPHGSSHFLSMLGNGPATPMATTLDITSNIHLGTDIIDPTSMTISPDAISTISAYEPQKRSPFNSEFVNEIRKNTLTAAESAKLLLVIGIRYIPQDAFLPQVFDAAKKEGLTIAFIGGNEDFEVYKKQFDNTQTQVIHISQYFDDDSIRSLEDLLKKIEQ